MARVSRGRRARSFILHPPSALPPHPPPDRFPPSPPARSTAGQAAGDAPGGRLRDGAAAAAHAGPFDAPVAPALAGTLTTRSLAVEATISDAVARARRLARRAPIGTVVLERSTVEPCRDLATTFEPLDGPDDLLVHRLPQASKKEVVS